MDRAAAPLNYLQTHGLRGDAAAGLFWGSAGISIAVVVIVCGLLAAALVRTRWRAAPATTSEQAGIGWIVIGVGVSALVLFGVTVWTVVSIAAAVRPPGALDALSVTVIAHRWWWEVRYADGTPSHSIGSANEIHLPVGPAVRLTLQSDDVIHSFWVPALAGKTDMIPGQVNTMWLQVREPGIYRGQCAEFCGLQHAHMALDVVAEPPAAFAAWRDRQIGAATPASGEGQAVFLQHCAVCHTLRGTRAGGILGPDLTHLATRRSLAAGTLPNTAGHLAAWIADPQTIKPGTEMPRVPLSGTELTAVVRFLEAGAP